MKRAKARRKSQSLKDEAIQEVRLDLKFQDFERRILDQLQHIRDQILTSNDKVVKELDDIRVNYQVSSGVSEEVRDKVEDHEKRISKLEGN